MSRERITSMAYGCAVGITARFFPAEDLRPYLPHWWHDESLEPEFEVEIFGTEEADEQIRGLEHWLAEHARDGVFLHAGMVAVDGEAVLLPGLTHAGKSDLTGALLRAGATYGSDEYAVVTPDGLVHAYPRRLSLRTPDGVVRVPAADLGGATLAEPVRVVAVADVRYEPGAEWSVTELTRGQTAMRLLDNAVAAQTRPVAVLDSVLAALATLRVGVHGTRGEADDAAREVLALLEGEAT